MKPNTPGMVGMVCSVVMVVMAIVVLIYTAGAKLATIETEIKGIQLRLVGIEETLEDMNERSLETSTVLGHGITGTPAVGDSIAVLGLLPPRASNGTVGAGLLSSDRAKSD